jgi:hypothetical protein
MGCAEGGTVGKEDVERHAVSASGAFPAQERTVLLDRIDQRTRWIPMSLPARENHELDVSERRKFVGRCLGQSGRHE